MRLRRTAATATILATAAATIAAGGSVPTANAVIDHAQPGARSAGHAEHGGHTDHAEAEDSRHGNPLVKPTRTQKRAVRDLVAGSGARVTWDYRFGTPRTIYPGPGKALSGKLAGSPVKAARTFVRKNRAALGLSKAQVRGLTVTRNHRLAKSKVTIVNLTQTVNGLSANRGGSMGMAVDGKGRVLSFTGSVAPNTSLLGRFALTPAAALTKAGAALGAASFVPEAAGETAGYTTFKTGLAAESYVKRVVFPTADGARAAYRVLLIKQLDEGYDVLVDARSGEVLYQKSLVQHEAEGIVFPNYPGAEGGGKAVKVSFPDEWVDPTGVHGVGVTTFGNNADTFKNWSNFLVPADQANRTVAPTGQFNFGFPNAWETSECQAAPPSYAQDADAASTNLFYHHNRVHDELYALGFTESAGNFQTDGGDPIMGLVQAGAVSGGAPTYTGRDNAYMLTLPDGIPPWSGMFLWEPINDAFEGPCVDGDFDAGVIEHEYAHGLSNRYVGTEDGALGGHQSGAMGEGWGDWYALNYLHREGLQDDAVVGAYVTGNEARGIRNWSYDDTEANFGDIGYDLSGPQVHADGEIWAATLWDVRKALVAKLGQAKGAEVSAFLVTDAMPLAPNDPSMLDMRDAVMKALDIRYHRRADFDVLQDAVYGGFARSGMGAGAANEVTEDDPTGANDIDPTPSFQHQNPERNGTVTVTVLNATTGKPLENANVIFGTLEAGVTPIGVTGADGTVTEPVVAGDYPLTIQAPGFGAQTVQGFTVAEGGSASRTVELAPNLASSANGATITTANGKNGRALIDDTELTRWKTPLRTNNAVIKLAREAEIRSFQVSAFTTSRFEAVRSFTIQHSKDGVNWKTLPIGEDAFDYQIPRPTVDDVHYRTFTLATPVKAQYLRVFADEALGETKENAQFGDLQVFGTVTGPVEPLPPQPLDEDFVEEFTILGTNPAGNEANGGIVGTELAEFCSFPPASQGLDGHVTKLPESFGDGAHKMSLSGGTTAVDLDVYFFDEDCKVLGSIATEAANEAGAIPSGTVYVLTSNWAGVAADVVLTAVDTK